MERIIYLIPDGKFVFLIQYLVFIAFPLPPPPFYFIFFFLLILISYVTKDARIYQRRYERVTHWRKDLLTGWTA